MINAKEFLSKLKEEGLNYFSGVPDSTFKELISEICEDASVQHRIACNECEAISLSSGYHLATGKVGVTYMQNSGFGKTINPLTSLLSKEVYSIPTVLLIGHRGKPNEKDEPQHKMMGKIMIKLLNDLEINYKVLPKDINLAIETVREMKELAEKEKYATALIIEKGTFEPRNNIKKIEDLELTRELAIKIIVDNLDKNSSIVSTTGKTSRELFETRISRGEFPTDFLTVGSMGCSSAIAVEISIQKPEKEIYCFDGDGAVIMQMGTLATIGNLKPKNFRHIIFNNNSYDSTGGQKTNSDSVDFGKVALASGYKAAKNVSSKEELIKEIIQLKNINGPSLTIINVKKGARKDLGRPTSTPIQNKEAFMNNLK